MLGEQEPRPDALSALRAARRTFLAGRRVEMSELAAELGVSRATLFRWVGGRDPLLAEVIWSVTEPTLRRAAEAAEGERGGPRLVDAIGRFAEATMGASSFVEFVRTDSERALRLLTTRASPFQSRLVAAFELLLREEMQAGRLAPPLSVHDTAYLLVRISETYVYADVIAGETPDPKKLRQAVAAILRVPTGCAGRSADGASRPA
ncbi:helix-turn-helix transcriptional regulator [Nocardioides albidus]|uniref:Helix-turn-helix transcriptional regulator n=2 Tax=Nocardioides albidus TaxID=1517589 RepID=A0A5C4VVS6_9ACTN|nr:helix-turn-helix transcriptional regulator [Nocardioides albidus]